MLTAFAAVARVRQEATLFLWTASKSEDDTTGAIIGAIVGIALGLGLQPFGGGYFLFLPGIKDGSDLLGATMFG
ncbi:hypothetical protein HH308_22185 [Gordonia sp. TBRC 11910]|uniref:Uncharacterized protein n=1 Tax=Gordonia asplenii TaxID=2725283 RepID=A0A848L0F9_9ACTN|nr:hypothetical protein [Gordonia asplenii]NMO03927.1 hypothetical protein [Gordonia asplenii]